MQNSLTIKTVESKKDFNDFINFPYELYKNDPVWVPRLKVDVKHVLGDKNPFWQHADKVLFLAVREGRIAGRISGTVDYNYIKFQKERVGFFGFFECVNDYEVAGALLDSVKEWLLKKDIEKIIGPFSPSTNDEVAFLLEGYDLSPYLMMPYNPPYYHDLMEKCGMRKAKDLVAFSLGLDNVNIQRYKKLEKRIMARIPEIKIKPIDLADYEKESRKVEEIYNNAWEKNWGFVPWTHEEFYDIVKTLKPLLAPGLALIATADDRPVGVCIVVPNYNTVLKKINGKLNLPGIIKFLYYKKKIKGMRMMVLGVVKEYRNRGIEGLFFTRILESSRKLGYKSSEASWILEDNTVIIQSGLKLGAKLYKKYRVYEMDIKRQTTGRSAGSGRVVVTGIGPITSIGIGKDDFWQGLVNGRSGINRISFFDASKYSSQIAGEINNFDPLKYIDKKDAKKMDRSAHFAVAASQLAIEDSGLDLEKEDRNRIGVIVGVGHAGNEPIQEAHIKLLENGPRKVSPYFLIKMLSNMPAANIAIRYGLKGPSTAITTACASGTHSIGDACRILERGDADVMVAGGTEAPILPLPFAGFCAARALSTRNDEPQKASKPFDRERDGFVMGEGAGIVVLETLEHARARGARIYAEVAGYGMSSDAFHLTAPAEGGDGFIRCMLAAINDAGLKAEEVDYINAHGTSTKLNDLNETLAIKKAFGEHAYKMMISSTKSMIGHLLGAAGAVEVIAVILTMQNKMIPPTINYKNPDPECDLDYVPNTVRKKDVNVVLSNSFGFGGFNATIVLKSFK